ncbi:MAG TPA: hypothetical protein VET51_12295 [Burkholderiales bacterium]|nr:hypothetical protein [Burkholderiales bacterium]
MRPEVVYSLGEARDFYSLTRALLALCEPFGPVHSFKLVHNPGVARVACFIELESTKQQPALLRALGAKMLNGAACFEIPVRKDFGSPRKVVALPAAGFDRRGSAGEEQRSP